MKLAFLTSITLNATNSISMPKFAELHASGSRGELAGVMRRTTKLLFFSTIPILAVLTIAGRPILGSFGTEFEQGYVILVVLVVGQVISTISGPVGNLLQMSGFERHFLVILSIFAVVNIALNLALIPPLGILGAALASAVTLSAKNIVCVIFIYRKLGFVSIYVPWATKPYVP
jgi:O-antigen/teichoic acid export membrane protein